MVLFEVTYSIRITFCSMMRWFLSEILCLGYSDVSHLSTTFFARILKVTQEADSLTGFE